MPLEVVRALLPTFSSTSRGKVL